MEAARAIEVRECPSDTCGGTRQLFRLVKKVVEDGVQTNYYICTGCEKPPPGKRIAGHIIWEEDA